MNHQKPQHPSPLRTDLSGKDKAAYHKKLGEYSKAVTQRYKFISGRYLQRYGLKKYISKFYIRPISKMAAGNMYFVLKAVFPLVMFCIFAAPVLLLAFQVYTFLKTGHWEWITMGDVGLFIDSADTKWVGFNIIMKWLIYDLWLGVYLTAIAIFSAFVGFDD